MLVGLDRMYEIVKSLPGEKVDGIYRTDPIPVAGDVEVRYFVPAGPVIENPVVVRTSLPVEAYRVLGNLREALYGEINSRFGHKQAGVRFLGTDWVDPNLVPQIREGKDIEGKVSFAVEPLTLSRVDSQRFRRL